MDEFEKLGMFASDVAKETYKRLGPKATAIAKETVFSFVEVYERLIKWESWGIPEAIWRDAFVSSMRHNLPPDNFIDRPQETP